MAPSPGSAWPTAPALEALRDQWLAAPDLAGQQRIAAQIQAQAFVDVPFLPLGQFFQPTTQSRTLEGGLKGNAVVLEHPPARLRLKAPTRPRLGARRRCSFRLAQSGIRLAREMRHEQPKRHPQIVRADIEDPHTASMVGRSRALLDGPAEGPD